MIALVLASLLAAAGTAASPAPSVTDVPAPATMTVPAVTAPEGAVVIRNSGSSNTLGYTIVVAPGGAATVMQSGATSQKTVPPQRYAALFDGVRALMPLDALPRAHCMRSVSFGSSTTVTYEGMRSPDLACLADPHAADLRRTIASLVSDLGITTFPQRGLRALQP